MCNVQSKLNGIRKFYLGNASYFEKRKNLRNKLILFFIQFSYYINSSHKCSKNLKEHHAWNIIVALKIHVRPFIIYFFFLLNQANEIESFNPKEQRVYSFSGTTLTLGKIVNFFSGINFMFFNKGVWKRGFGLSAKRYDFFCTIFS